MSRSIHTTHQGIAWLRRQLADAPDEMRDAKQRQLRDEEQAMRRKRLLKQQVITERRSQSRDGTPRRAVDVPVRIIDKHPCLHHPVFEEDIHAVLRKLPEQATDGLAEIRLELGCAYMNEQKRACEESDPWFGRPSVPWFRGVYSGRYMGTYHPASASISVYGNAYDAGDLPIPVELVEVFLRLRGLETLMHEVAHHHDEQCRVARGRWLADRKENFENYAERIEHRWTHEVVVPYLEERYSAQVRRLRAFVARKGGLLVPSGFFAADNRATGRDGKIRITRCTSAAFCGWVDKLNENPSWMQSRLSLAWELHFIDRYDDCLRIVERCLRRFPSDSELLVCRADTLIHLDMCDEALACVQAILVVDAAHQEAWRLKARAWRSLREWNTLLQVCEEWSKLCAAPKEIAYERAIAFCGLGLGDEAREHLEQYLSFMLPAKGDRIKQRRQTAWRNIHRQAGRAVESPF